MSVSVGKYCIADLGYMNVWFVSAHMFPCGREPYERNQLRMVENDFKENKCRPILEGVNMDLPWRGRRLKLR